MADLVPGDIVDVRALHADGKAYRWWQDTIEAVHDDHVVTCSPVGNVINSTEGGWVSGYASRTFFWLARPYVLSEAYAPSGELLEVSAHVTSPTVIRGYQLTYTDLELDVVWKPGLVPEVVNDRFARAAIRYGFSPQFRSSCYRALVDALRLVAHWRPRGIPRVNP